MSLESFREACRKSKFYYFNSVSDFDKRIDWNGKSVKNIIFKDGLEARIGEHNPMSNAVPTPYFAYGTKK